MLGRIRNGLEALEDCMKQAHGSVSFPVIYHTDSVSWCSQINRLDPMLNDIK